MKHRSFCRLFTTKVIVPFNWPDWQEESFSLVACAQG